MNGYDDAINDNGDPLSMRAVTGLVSNIIVIHNGEVVERLIAGPHTTAGARFLENDRNAPCVHTYCSCYIEYAVIYNPVNSVLLCYSCSNEYE